MDRGPSIKARLLEWHNIAIQSSCYLGYVPDWASQISVPSWEEIDELTEEVEELISSSTARLLRGNK